jgi:GAF domain-containing protein
VAGERTAKVWALIAAAQEGDGPVAVAALCRAAVSCLGVDGASVTATSNMVAREPLFASDELSAQLEELQFTTGEGPGAEDLEFGAPLLIPDLDSVAARWPIFAPAAVMAGARALFVVPLQAGAIQVGVLAAYRSRPGPLAVTQLADALVLAEIALQMVLDAAAGISRSPDYQPLEGLSDRRAEVYQAVGMISVQLGVDLEEAFVRLRAHAFADGAALGDAADDVVNRRLRLDPDRGSGPEA